MSVYDDFDAPASNGVYFKFGDATPHKIRIASEPIVYKNSFKGKDTGKKYAFLIWNYDEDAAQVMSVPQTALKLIWDMAREKGDPQTYDARIMRSGSGFTTEYQINGREEKTELTAEQKAALAEVDPIEALGKGNGATDIQWLADAQGDKKRGDAPGPVQAEEPQEVATDEGW